ncbi:hypothetical protein X727_28010 [Mesorhizobium sp. L103C119B0]|nr:hypothetical protein X727_28010 [Mesorhizobium sp. L103C119B0]
MADNNRNALALAHGGDRLSDCSFAFRVEMDIGFIQHNKERVSIKGTGKTDKLALPGGKCRSDLTNRSFVSVLKSEDQFVRARCFRRGDNSLRVRIIFKTSDVFGNGAIEQFNTLWQIADVTA